MLGSFVAVVHTLAPHGVIYSFCKVFAFKSYHLHCYKLISCEAGEDQINETQCYHNWWCLYQKFCFFLVRLNPSRIAHSFTALVVYLHAFIKSFKYISVAHHSWGVMEFILPNLKLFLVRILRFLSSASSKLIQANNPKKAKQQCLGSQSSCGLTALYHLTAFQSLQTSIQSNRKITWFSGTKALGFFISTLFKSLILRL